MTGSVQLQSPNGDTIKTTADAIMPTLNEKTLEDEEIEKTMPNVVFAINSLDEIPPVASTPDSLTNL